MLESTRQLLTVCKDAIAIAACRRKAAMAKVGFYASMPRDLRRKFDKAVGVKQFISTQRDLTKQLTPFFGAQIKSMSKELGELGDTRTVSLTEKSADDAAETLVNLIFNPDDWFAKLVDIALPTLALGMAQAGKAQLVVLGLAARKSTRAIEHKATTATEWLVDHAGDGEELIAALDGQALRIMTELPQWMKESIAEELQNTFSQPYWRDISETTGGDAEKFISQGLEEGWSINRISSEMARSFTGSTLAYAKMRAKRIAITESGNALNGSRVASINKLSEELGPQVPIRTSWLSILGNTTRSAHAALDGVPADADGLFNLNGTLVPWPSHFSLPVEERVNCKCQPTTEFGMDEDEARKLIQEHEERRDEAEDEIDVPAPPAIQSAFPAAEVGSGRSVASVLQGQEAGSLIASGDAVEALLADDDEALDAVQGYTASEHETLNAALRAGEVHRPASRTGKQVRTLDKLTNAQLAEPATVYRGLGGRTGQRMLKDIEEGTVPESLKDLGFGSTSANPSKAVGFAGLDKDGTPIVMQVRASHGAYIQPVSVKPSELELLMPRGTSYVIEGVDKDVMIEFGDEPIRATVLRARADHE